MNRDIVIALARQAGICMSNSILLPAPDGEVEALERFAALVADYLRSVDIHSCHHDCQRPMCVAVRAAVAAEREACAKVLEAHPAYDFCRCPCECAVAIRSRT